MTHRFPHDFWADQNLDVQSGFRFDASLPESLGASRPYGFSRGMDWSALTPHEELVRHYIDETVLDEADLGDEPLDEGPRACLVEDLHPEGISTGLFVPEKYEPNYPYPVVVWFHDAGGDEADLLSLMPRISERNAFGLSLRGPVSSEQRPKTQRPKAGFDWPREPASVSRLEGQLFQTLCELRRNVHIHSERIFLAGAGTGATMALRLLVNRPEWFAGVFALGGELPAFDGNGPTHPELRDRRVFWAQPPGSETEALLQNARLWRAAGLNLVTEPEEGPHCVTSQRLSQLNHWLMESVCAAV